MSKINRLLYSPIDSKIYLIFAFLAVILLFESISEIKPVIVDVKDFLGLIGHLTLTYWIGFALVIIFSIRLYLDREIKNNFTYLTYLIVIGLFLFGVSIFSEENARWAWSYYPAGEIKQILKTGFIDNFNDESSYHSWPGTHFISAFMINIANISVDDLIKYMPLFWVLTVIFITFEAGRITKLPGNQSFMISLFMISSFWGLNYYYGGPSTGFMLYLLFFVSIMSIYRKNETRNIIFMMLTFIAITMTHMLTTMALIISYLFSSKFIRTLRGNRLKILMFVVVIFIGWHMYITTSMFYFGIKELNSEIGKVDVFTSFGGQKYEEGNTLIRQIIHSTRISYLFIYVLFMGIASIQYLRGKIRKENKDYFKVYYLWFIGVISLLVFRYGAEMDDRVYMYALLPMALIIIMTFDKKVIAVLAVLLLILHIPAHYGEEGSDMVYSSDLKGSEFISSKLGVEDTVNYFYGPLIKYYNTTWRHSRGFKNGYYNPDLASINDSNYIVSSKQLDNYLIYSFGKDEIQDWLNTEQGQSKPLIYDNGNYRLYKFVPDAKVNI